MGFVNAAESREELDGSADRDELAPGTVLFHGQFTVQRHVRSGGFGITYLALDSLNREVVLKECFVSAFCSRQLTRVSARTRDSRETVQKVVKQFVQEAHQLSRLSHPNIVGVHQVFEDNDTAYMALDYLRGSDLLQQLDERQVTYSPVQIVQLTRKLVDAVAYIHRSGLMHGDISPDNILMTEGDVPVLIDFGAARKIDRGETQPYTGLGVVKDGYSPHELYAQDGNVGPWSDLYSLGASIYHTVAGTRPSNSQTRLVSLVSSTPDPCLPLAGRFPGFPDGFLESIDKAMSVVPSNRFQKADEWLATLDEMFGQQDQDMKILGRTIGSARRNPAGDKAQVGGAPESTAPLSTKTTPKGKKMAVNLKGLRDISGFIAGCLVDSDSGLMLGSEVAGSFDIETAAAANVEVVRAKRNAMKLLGLDDRIEDILISLGTQLHLIRPLEKDANLFIYAALDRKVANLGLARATLKKVEQEAKP